MKQLLLLAILLVSTTVLTAQVRRNTVAKDSINSTKPVATKNNKKAMMRELDLSKVQKAKLKELNQEQKQAREQIQSNDSLSADEKRSRLKELNKQRTEKLQSILTKEQAEKMKVLIKQKKKEID